jgi:hypothetical protein
VGVKEREERAEGERERGERWRRGESVDEGVCVSREKSLWQEEERKEGERVKSTKGKALERNHVGSLQLIWWLEQVTTSTIELIKPLNCSLDPSTVSSGHGHRRGRECVQASFLPINARPRGNDRRGPFIGEIT